MHGLYMDPMALKMEQPYEIHHEHNLGLGQMVGMDGESRSPNDSPSYDYGGTFNFSTSAHAESEQPYSSAPYQPAFTAPQPLHPLNTNTLWPSQLTNPSGSSPPAMLALQPRPLAPVTKESPARPASPPTPPPPKQAPTLPTSRRTLTDNDRRRMCKYHQENPTIKQTEIGAMFGVERSTVSKVLRNKEKYLVLEDGRGSPSKKSRSKFPDIERTLTNWAKNRISEKLPIDDDMIREEARKFASTLASADCHDQVNDPVWLEKFKQKNHLPGARPKGEKITAESLSPKSGSQTPNGAISNVGWDGMPITHVKEEAQTRTPDSIFNNANSWGHAPSQSTASINTCFSDTNFSTEFRSPASPFYSPMSSCGPSPSMPAQKAPRLPTLAPAKLHRRQTVPMINSNSTSPDSATSKVALPLPSIIDPAHDGEMDTSPIGIDTNIAYTRPSITLPTHSTANSISTSATSPFSMGPPSSSISTTTTPTTTTSSSPHAPPSQEEARAALETLQKFIEHQPNGTIDPRDYLVMGKWMQLLKLENGGMPGGMHSISMAERADGTAPMGRKRSEHSLS